VENQLNQLILPYFLPAASEIQWISDPNSSGQVVDGFLPTFILDPTNGFWEKEAVG
jgi:hypothetical protein